MYSYMAALIIVQVLTAFYENRLKDHHLLVPSVLQGLKALSMSQVLPEGLAVSILKALFQEVHVQSLMQIDRHSVYSIISNFMESREEELKGLGSDFTYGFIQAMDGEKDPRNLLLAFKLARDIVVKKFAMGPFVEEFFEVTSCYFPIDFSPPSSDPHGITQEELVLSLRAVLTATSQFAEFFLPLLIEKLDSDVQSAKLDSLQTLTSCCHSYGQKELMEYLPSLWSNIRREVFQTDSKKIESEALSALQALTSCLSRSVVEAGSEDILDSFLSTILQDCKHHLCEPDMKLVWPSTKLLQASASASHRAYHKVTYTVLPLLLEEYSKRTQSSQRRTILEMLHGFIKLQQKWLQDLEDENALAVQKESLCILVFSALTDCSVHLQLVGIKTLAALGMQQGLLSQNDVELAVSHLNRLILEEDDHQSCSAAIEASGSLSAIYPSAFITKMVPVLLKELQTDSMETEEKESLSQSKKLLNTQRSLRTLAVISTHLSILKETVPILLQHLREAHQGSSLDADNAIATCHSLHVIAEHCRESVESNWYFFETAVPCLFGLALQHAKQDSGSFSVFNEERVLSSMVPIISTTCAHLEPQLASQSVLHVVALFLNGDVSFLSENNIPHHFQPFKREDPEGHQSRLIVLLMAFICSLPRTFAVPEQEKLMSELVDLCCSCHHLFTYISAAKCFAGLINKFLAGEPLDTVLQSTLRRIEQGLAQNAGRVQIFTLLLWVTKALILRYHPLAEKLTNGKLTSGRDDIPTVNPRDDPSKEKVSYENAFVISYNSDAGIIKNVTEKEWTRFASLSDLSVIFEKPLKCIFRKSFKIKNLIENRGEVINLNRQDKKSNYLKALSHVLNSIPKQVLMTELPSLLSLLMEALHCPDQVVQLSTLRCLHPLLMDAPQVMSVHAETLVTKLLALTASPAMKIRIAALQCIHALTQLPNHVVIPYRARVIRALAKPLDDKKRLVRKEAVTARGEWFLLGAPGR
ncbi:MMS19 nucleotide excision repair protein homolog [Protopterus annectens]|uniref:MMS19 nucleotide excision repair protein homolog n=1 Tax=Protopterus annectens TaxID=7888 RepID=UPI001CFBB5C8|nr:MMS19 nucleotide excision repair protein homolog [Protopterus annectens]